MIAKRLTITNLYGYFNKTIKLDSKINILVGINGSGKTSVLNILNWMLSPSLGQLCVTEFEKLELLFSFDNDEYLIEVIQDTKTLSYRVISTTKGVNYAPIVYNLKVPPNRLSQNDSYKETLIQEYQRLTPTRTERDTWEFIFDILPKPIVIGLDRYLYTNVKANTYYTFKEDAYHKIYSSEEQNKITPLEQVKKLANREYTIYKNKIVELNRILNSKIMLAAFDEITHSSIEDLENFTMISTEQIDSLHKKVEKFFKETLTENRPKRDPKLAESSLSKITNYFSNLKKVVLEAEKVKDDQKFTTLYLANISQFKKLRQFIKEFEDFEKQSQDFYSDLKIYLDTLNKFFIDSSKELAFHKAISELVFNVLDTKGKVLIKHKDIITLSSGEKQILILLTYLKFYDKNGTIFIIDEPELSLHPKWQEDFLPSVLALSPPNTQIIIATHSPIIVGDNKEFCKVLLPYNS